MGLSGAASYFLEVDRDDLAVVDEPGTFLDFDLTIKLTFDDRRVTLQTHFDRAPLDVHHHVPPLNADVERHRQLQKKVSQTWGLHDNGSFRKNKR